MRIKGQGPATILVARGTALTVTQSFAVTVENLAVVSGAAAAAAVRLRSVVGASLQDLVVLSYGSSQGGGSGVELSGVGLLVALRRNVIVGRTGVDAGSGDKIGLFAAGLRVEDNVVVGFERGIDLGGLAAYLYSCRVARNEVLSGEAGGIVATGAVAPGGTLDVVGNKVATSGAGIVVGADATVDSNAVNRLGSSSGTDGIVVDAGSFPVAAGHVRITGNRVHDRAGTGIALRTAVRTWMVKENVVSDVGAGIAIEGKGSAERVAVDNNQVLDVDTTRESGEAALGILLTRAASVGVVGNTVARVGLASPGARVRGGIVVFAADDARVSGNVVDAIGPPGGFLGVAVGIGVIGPFEAASVQDNSSRFSADQAAPTQGGWYALLVQSAGLELIRLGDGKAAVPSADGAAVVLTGAWAFAAVARGDHAGVGANTLVGGGSLPTCLVRVRGDVVAEGNQCRHEEGQQLAGILLQATAITASSNRVRGGKSMIVLQVPENRFAALGNLAAGGTHLASPGAGLPAPWKPLNPTVS